MVISYYMLLHVNAVFMYWSAPEPRKVGWEGRTDSRHVTVVCARTRLSLLFCPAKAVEEHRHILCMHRAINEGYYLSLSTLCTHIDIFTDLLYTSTSDLMIAGNSLLWFMPYQPMVQKIFAPFPHILHIPFTFPQGAAALERHGQRAPWPPPLAGGRGRQGRRREGLELFGSSSENSVYMCLLLHE